MQPTTRNSTAIFWVKKHKPIDLFFLHKGYLNSTLFHIRKKTRSLAPWYRLRPRFYLMPVIKQQPGFVAPEAHNFTNKPKWKSNLILSVTVSPSDLYKITLIPGRTTGSVESTCERTKSLHNQTVHFQNPLYKKKKKRSFGNATRFTSSKYADTRGLYKNFFFVSIPKPRSIRRTSLTLPAVINKRDSGYTKQKHTPMHIFFKNNTNYAQNSREYGIYNKKRRSNREIYYRKAIGNLCSNKKKYSKFLYNNKKGFKKQNRRVDWFLHIRSMAKALDLKNRKNSFFLEKKKIIFKCIPAESFRLPDVYNNLLKKQKSLLNYNTYSRRYRNELNSYLSYRSENRHLLLNCYSLLVNHSRIVARYNTNTTQYFNFVEDIGVSNEKKMKSRVNSHKNKFFIEKKKKYFTKAHLNYLTQSYLLKRTDVLCKKRQHSMKGNTTLGKSKYDPIRRGKVKYRTAAAAGVSRTYNLMHHTRVKKNTKLLLSQRERKSFVKYNVLVNAHRRSGAAYVSNVKRRLRIFNYKKKHFRYRAEKEKIKNTVHLETKLLKIRIGMKKFRVKKKLIRTRLRNKTVTTEPARYVNYLVQRGDKSNPLPMLLYNKVQDRIRSPQHGYCIGEVYDKQDSLYDHKRRAYSYNRILKLNNTKIISNNTSANFVYTKAIFLGSVPQMSRNLKRRIQEASKHAALQNLNKRYYRFTTSVNTKMYSNVKNTDLSKVKKQKTHVLKTPEIKNSVRSYRYNSEIKTHFSVSNIKHTHTASQTKKNVFNKKNYFFYKLNEILLSRNTGLCFSKPSGIGVKKLTSLHKQRVKHTFNKPKHTSNGVTLRAPTIPVPIPKAGTVNNTLLAIKKLLSLPKTHQVANESYNLVTPESTVASAQAVTSGISMGLTNVSVRLANDLGLYTPLRTIFTKLYECIRELPSRTSRAMNKSSYVFTFFLLTVFLDTSLWTNYIDGLFYRTPFYGQRRLFYTLRRLLPETTIICSDYANILGMYFSMKGKVATRAGLRKKVLRTHAGLYNSADFGIQHKYRFKQIWAKSGAIGLKTIITCGPKHR